MSLAGPAGKYGLAGVLSVYGQDFETAFFGLLDCINILWRRSHTTAEAASLVDMTRKALAQVLDLFVQNYMMDSPAAAALVTTDKEPLLIDLVLSRLHNRMTTAKRGKREEVSEAAAVEPASLTPDGWRYTCRRRLRQQGRGRSRPAEGSDDGNGGSSGSG